MTARGGRRWATAAVGALCALLAVGYSLTSGGARPDGDPLSPEATAVLDLLEAVRPPTGDRSLTTWALPTRPDPLRRADAQAVLALAGTPAGRPGEGERRVVLGALATATPDDALDALRRLAGYRRAFGGEWDDAASRATAQRLDDLARRRAAAAPPAERGYDLAALDALREAAGLPSPPAAPVCRRLLPSADLTAFLGLALAPASQSCPAVPAGASAPDAPAPVTVAVLQAVGRLRERHPDRAALDALERSHLDAARALLQARGPYFRELPATLTELTAVVYEVALRGRPALHVDVRRALVQIVALRGAPVDLADTAPLADGILTAVARRDLSGEDVPRPTDEPPADAPLRAERLQWAHLLAGSPAPAALPLLRPGDDVVASVVRSATRLTGAGEGGCADRGGTAAVVTAIAAADPALLVREGFRFWSLVLLDRWRTCHGSDTPLRRAAAAIAAAHPPAEARFDLVEAWLQAELSCVTGVGGAVPAPARLRADTVPATLAPTGELGPGAAAAAWLRLDELARTGCARSLEAFLLAPGGTGRR